MFGVFSIDDDDDDDGDGDDGDVVMVMMMMMMVMMLITDYDSDGDGHDDAADGAGFRLKPVFLSIQLMYTSKYVFLEI